MPFSLRWSCGRRAPGGHHSDELVAGEVREKVACGGHEAEGYRTDGPGGRASSSCSWNPDGTRRVRPNQTAQRFRAASSQGLGLSGPRRPFASSRCRGGAGVCLMDGRRAPVTEHRRRVSRWAAPARRPPHRGVFTVARPRLPTASVPDLDGPPDLAVRSHGSWRAATVTWLRGSRGTPLRGQRGSLRAMSRDDRPGRRSTARRTAYWWQASR